MVIMNLGRLENFGVSLKKIAFLFFSFSFFLSLSLTLSETLSLFFCCGVSWQTKPSRTITTILNSVHLDCSWETSYSQPVVPTWSAMLHVQGNAEGQCYHLFFSLSLCLSPLLFSFWLSLCFSCSLLDPPHLNSIQFGQSVTASDFGSNGPRFQSGRGRCVESLDKALYSHCPKEKPSH